MLSISVPIIGESWSTTRTSQPFLHYESTKNYPSIHPKVVDSLHGLHFEGLVSFKDHSVAGNIENIVSKCLMLRD